MPENLLQSYPRAPRRLNLPAPHAVHALVASRLSARALEIIAIVLLAVAGFAVGVYYLGQDYSWDLRNYHFYNPHALLHGRLFWDIQPAMRQTYFNPLIDLPFYLLATHSSPLFTSLALAAFQSLTLVFIYFICRELLRGSTLPVAAQVLTALAVAGVGVLSPINVHQIGLTAGDNTSGVFVLAGLLCMLVWLRHTAAEGEGKGEGERPRPSPLLVLAAGVLAGVAVGLKPTNGTFAVALILAIYLVGLRWREKFRVTLWYGVGGLAGVGAAAGWWWWMIYAEFGNPLFPQLNHIFQSPYVAPRAYGTTNPLLVTGARGGWERFLETAFYPFYHNALFSGTGQRVSIPMDLRLPAFYLLSLGGVGALLWHRVRGGAGSVSRAAGGRSPRGGRLPHLYLALFLFLSYLIWLDSFAIYRYALLIDLLIPVACFAILMLVGLSLRRTLVATAALLLVFLVSYQEDPTPRLPWQESFFQVAVPAEPQLEGALVVITGHDPVAYMIPFFPASTRFVRISGNLFYMRQYASREVRFSYGMGALLREAIDGHPGPIFALFSEPDREEAEDDLAFFGLALEADDPGIRIAEEGPERPILLFRAERQVAAPLVRR